MKKTIAAILTLVTPLIILSLTMVAQTPPGIGVGPYIRQGVDARASGMGGAFVAVVKGSAVAYYNPAGLAGISSLNLGGMYSEPYGKDFGVSFQYISAAGPLGIQSDSVVSGLGVGLMWIGLTISDIPVWSEQGPGSTFNANSALYLASAGIPLLDNWAVGVSLKYYHATILEGNSTGLGFDVGILGTLSLADVPIKVGINATDIGGTTIHWSGTKGGANDHIPWINKMGLSAALLDGKVVIAGDIDWAVERPQKEQKIHLGGEIWPINELALRVGWSGNLVGEGRISAGVGVYLLDSFSIDYAYLSARTFGVTHILSMGISF